MTKSIFNDPYKGVYVNRETVIKGIYKFYMWKQNRRSKKPLKTLVLTKIECVMFIFTMHFVKSSFGISVQKLCFLPLVRVTAAFHSISNCLKLL